MSFPPTSPSNQPSTTKEAASLPSSSTSTTQSKCYYYLHMQRACSLLKKRGTNSSNSNSSSNGGKASADAVANHEDDQDDNSRTHNETCRSSTSPQKNRNHLTCSLPTDIGASIGVAAPSIDSSSNNSSPNTKATQDCSSSGNSNASNAECNNTFKSNGGNENNSNDPQYITNIPKAIKQRTHEKKKNTLTETGALPPQVEASVPHYSISSSLSLSKFSLSSSLMPSLSAESVLPSRPPVSSTTALSVSLLPSLQPPLAGVLGSILPSCNPGSSLNEYDMLLVHVQKLGNTHVFFVNLYNEIANALSSVRTSYIYVPAMPPHPQAAEDSMFPTMSDADAVKCSVCIATRQAIAGEDSEYWNNLINILVSNMCTYIKDMRIFEYMCMHNNISRNDSITDMLTMISELWVSFVRAPIGELYDYVGISTLGDLQNNEYYDNSSASGATLCGVAEITNYGNSSRPETSFKILVDYLNENFTNFICSFLHSLLSESVESPSIFQSVFYNWYQPFCRNLLLSLIQTNTPSYNSLCHYKDTTFKNTKCIKNNNNGDVGVNGVDPPPDKQRQLCFESSCRMAEHIITFIYRIAKLSICNINTNARNMFSAISIETIYELATVYFTQFHHIHNDLYCLLNLFRDHPKINKLLSNLPPSGLAPLSALPPPPSPQPYSVAVMSTSSSNLNSLPSSHTTTNCAEASGANNILSKFDLMTHEEGTKLRDKVGGDSPSVYAENKDSVENAALSENDSPDQTELHRLNTDSNSCPSSNGYGGYQPTGNKENKKPAVTTLENTTTIGSATALLSDVYLQLEDIKSSMDAGKHYDASSSSPVSSTKSSGNREPNSCHNNYSSISSYQNTPRSVQLPDSSTIIPLSLIRFNPQSAECEECKCILKGYMDSIVRIYEICRYNSNNSNKKGIYMCSMPMVVERLGFLHIFKSLSGSGNTTSTRRSKSDNNSSSDSGSIVSTRSITSIDNSNSHNVDGLIILLCRSIKESRSSNIKMANSTSISVGTCMSSSSSLISPPLYVTIEEFIDFLSQVAFRSASSLSLLTSLVHKNTTLPYPSSIRAKQLIHLFASIRTYLKSSFKRTHSNKTAVEDYPNSNNNHGGNGDRGFNNSNAFATISVSRTDKLSIIDGLDRCYAKLCKEVSRIYNAIVSKDNNSTSNFTRTGKNQAKNEESIGSYSGCTNPKGRHTLPPKEESRKPLLVKECRLRNVPAIMISSKNKNSEVSKTNSHNNPNSNSSNNYDVSQNSSSNKKLRERKLTQNENTDALDDTPSEPQQFLRKSERDSNVGNNALAALPYVDSTIFNGGKRLIPNQALQQREQKIKEERAALDESERRHQIRANHIRRQKHAIMKMKQEKTQQAAKEQEEQYRRKAFMEKLEVQRRYQRQQYLNRILDSFKNNLDSKSVSCNRTADEREKADRNTPASVNKSAISAITRENIKNRLKQTFWSEEIQSLYKDSRYRSGLRKVFKSFNSRTNTDDDSIDVKDFTKVHKPRHDYDEQPTDIYSYHNPRDVGITIDSSAAPNVRAHNCSMLKNEKDPTNDDQGDGQMGESLRMCADAPPKTQATKGREVACSEEADLDTVVNGSSRIDCENGVLLEKVETHTGTTINEDLNGNNNLSDHSRNSLSLDENMEANTNLQSHYNTNTNGVSAYLNNAVSSDASEDEISDDHSCGEIESGDDVTGNEAPKQHNEDSSIYSDAGSDEEARNESKAQDTSSVALEGISRFMCRDNADPLKQALGRRINGDDDTCVYKESNREDGDCSDEEDERYNDDYNEKHYKCDDDEDKHTHENAHNIFNDRKDDTDGDDNSDDDDDLCDDEKNDADDYEYDCDDDDDNALAMEEVLPVQRREEHSNTDGEIRHYSQGFEDDEEKHHRESDDNVDDDISDEDTYDSDISINESPHNMPQLHKQ